MAEENIEITRDYIDTYSVKDFAVNEVMGKYFEDMTPSQLTTGTMGMMTEMISTVVEDSFNAGSSLVNEAFATRAKMESSIYSNAAIFQLSNAFSDAGRCRFIIALAAVIPAPNALNKIFAGNFISPLSIPSLIATGIEAADILP